MRFNKKRYRELFQYSQSLKRKEKKMYLRLRNMITNQKTGNFVGFKKDGFNRKAKNLPPNQTPVNTFESDVTQITPIIPMKENSSPGVTPVRSFKTDVMGITPSQLDNSQLLLLLLEAKNEL